MPDHYITLTTDNDWKHFMPVLAQFSELCVVSLTLVSVLSQTHVYM